MRVSHYLRIFCISEASILQLLNLSTSRGSTAVVETQYKASVCTCAYFLTFLRKGKREFDEEKFSFFDYSQQNN